MSGWFRVLFLFSSFGPLYGVLCVGLAVQKHFAPAAFAGAAAIASIYVFLYLRSGFKDSQPFQDSAEVQAQLDENILSYLVAYLPPLLIDDFQNLAKVAPAAGFYVLVLALMLRTDTLYVNPFFILLGYRIYRVKLISGRTVTIITKKLEIVGSEKLNLYEVQPSRLYFAD
ncbi:hypothetical protein [Phenylobacterium kunshanense]|uniref:Uncharacterized protein n=1 Tax=Phenylobacterium kunshanense TaxID=1445034 RepID=A0A328BQ43_9CAUL|nr:hypothetical protein [Phenylobacterium kunshanense]RAK68719.1 hypothetical protein DJ019_01515 [Phenylobacterium kunshanense]